MNHQEKQRIFDEYAKQFMAPDFNHLMFWSAGKNRLEHIFAACDLVQAEQQKRIAENARMKFHDGVYKTNEQMTYLLYGADNIQIDKDSITNPENKIQ